MRIYGPADVWALAGQLRGGLADRADQAKELIELVPQLVGLVQRAELLFDSAERTLARADELLSTADATRARMEDVSARASEVLERTDALVARGEALLTGAESVAPGALPMLGQIIEAIEPDEVRAINGLIDRLPGMIEQVDRIGPDVHRILESVSDLSQATKGVPGMEVLIRRGGRKDAEHAAQELSSDVGTPPST